MFAVGAEVNSMTPTGIYRPNLPMTPGRIPKFIIPPKLSLSPRLRLHLKKDDDMYKLLSPESPEKGSPKHLPPTASPYISTKLRFTPKTKAKHLQKSTQEDLSDVSTRAAMSLEHVEKITTPYGFRTLAASPNVGRRESLFHKQRRCAERKGTAESVASPASPNSMLNFTKKHNSAKKQQDSPNNYFSPQKSRREGLQEFLNKPLAVLKSFTPKKKNLQKASESCD